MFPAPGGVPHRVQDVRCDHQRGGAEQQGLEVQRRWQGAQHWGQEWQVGFTKKKKKIVELTNFLYENSPSELIGLKGKVLHFHNPKLFLVWWNTDKINEGGGCPSLEFLQGL